MIFYNKFTCILLSTCVFVVSLGIRQKPTVPGDKVPGRQLLTKQTSTEKAIQRYDKSHVFSSSHSAISVSHIT